MRCTPREENRPTLPNREAKPFFVCSFSCLGSSPTGPSTTRSSIISKKAAFCSRRAPGMRWDFSEQVLTTGLLVCLLGLTTDRVRISPDDGASVSKVTEDPKSPAAGFFWNFLWVRGSCAGLTMEESVMVESMLRSLCFGELWISRKLYETTRERDQCRDRVSGRLLGW